MRLVIIFDDKVLYEINESYFEEKIFLNCKDVYELHTFIFLLNKFIEIFFVFIHGDIFNELIDA